MGCALASSASLVCRASTSWSNSDVASSMTASLAMSAESVTVFGGDSRVQHVWCCRAHRPRECVCCHEV